MTSPFDLSRRRFVQTGLVSLVAASVASPALAARLIRPQTQGSKHLAFYNTHTGERLSVVYWQNGAYDRAAWGKINHILRDHYSGDESVMNLGLIDLVHDLQQTLGNDRPVEIISGYRSPATNRRLHERSNGVANKSYHLRGMAVDIRLDGTSLSGLRNAALTMRRGGVGYYPSSQFVHVDVGPVRRWG